MKQVAAILGAGLVIAGTGCATPRTTIAVGAAAVVTSVVLIATLEDSDCTEDDDGDCLSETLAQGMANGITVLIAGGLGLTGVGLLASGTVSLYEESLTKPPLLLPAPTSAVAALGPEPAHAAGHERLALQIRLAARANRCPAAELMRHELRCGEPLPRFASLEFFSGARQQCRDSTGSDAARSKRFS